MKRITIRTCRSFEGVNRLFVAATVAMFVACNGVSVAPDGAIGHDAKTDTNVARDSGLPPVICRSPQSLGNGPYFLDKTTAYGLDQANLAIT
ncbi:MAG: hypothetical protein V1754_11660, partial [Pseudomonadota bacterium]